MSPETELKRLLKLHETLLTAEVYDEGVYVQAIIIELDALSRRMKRAARRVAAAS